MRSPCNHGLLPVSIRRACSLASSTCAASGIRRRKWSRSRSSPVLVPGVSSWGRYSRRRIGGMNHFMLPEPTGERDGWSSTVGRAARYGNEAMEQLINAILKAGGKRDDLEVKIFGGGRVLATMTDFGQRNIAFVQRYIATEKLK